jgi:hypothetical protein
MRLTDEQRSPHALSFETLFHGQSVTSQAWVIAGASESISVDATMAAHIASREIA